MVDLKAPITQLKGVGKTRASSLEAMGIRTLEDLLYYRPLRYEDRRGLPAIHQLAAGQWATICGEIQSARSRFFRGKRMSQFECEVADKSGSILCRWWNMPFLKQHYLPGKRFFAYGQLKDGSPLRMDHPEIEWVEEDESKEPVHTSRVVPVYRCQKGVGQRWLRSLMHQFLQDHGSLVADPYPQACMEGFLPQSDAVEKLHFPKEPDESHAARERLALNEALKLQQEVRQRRKAFAESVSSLPTSPGSPLAETFIQSLAFDLTTDQRDVLVDIESDLRQKHPMRRLLQGDVGTGKTLVSVIAALQVIACGHSVILMVPTTLLAQQHYQTISKQLSDLNIPVILRTSASHGEPSQASNLPSFTVGTHALLHVKQPTKSVGLIMIDEQHKFGVAQRQQILKNQEQAHLLIMTATPIPRTMGLALYADLDVSTMRQTPKGRGRIRTYLREEKDRHKIEDFLETTLKEGRQVFIIFPRIEATESTPKSLMEEQEALTRRYRAFGVGLMHGKMREEEIRAVMNQLKNGEIGLLLSTSMIEVGVDIPNATVMIVENASHFGMAQLHQMRGRIGRGPHDAHCIFMGDSADEVNWQRLRKVEQSLDGFEIAEEDFRLRGPGDWQGQDQSGTQHWRFLQLPEDESLLIQAKEWTGTWAEPAKLPQAAP